MSKRNLRRLAAVGGVALALGAAAPAMALRLDTGAVAGAAVVVDTDELLGTTGDLDVQNLIDFGRDAILFANYGVLLPDAAALTTLLNVNVISPTLGGVANIVEEADLGDILPDCSLVAVAACNNGDATVIGGDVIGGDVIGGSLNVLNVLSGNDDDGLGLNVFAPVIAPVGVVAGNILNGGILGGDGDGLGFLGSLLNVEADAGVGVLGLIGIF